MAQINKPTDYFETKLYAGNGSTQSITGVGFQPDWVWVKSRTSTGWHNLVDAVRGVTKTIYTNRGDAEGTYANSLTSFNSDGFTIGNNGDFNGSGNNYASWNWLANGAGSANTDGTISSTVSANTTSGFSIVSYTGNATSGATVGHGLGVAPDVIIVKNRSVIKEWNVYHSANTSSPETDYLILNGTNATGDNVNRWNDTAPTSTVFSLGNGSETNDSNNMIAYCFAEKKGFSKFGSYTGNGNADGPFIYTGFKPAFIIFKRTDSTGEWVMHDTKRDPFNVMDKRLWPSLSNAETTASVYNMDFLSNGFKTRNTNTLVNASGGTHIFMAFAENPLVGTNNIPATAR